MKLQRADCWIDFTDMRAFIRVGPTLHVLDLDDPFTMPNKHAQSAKEYSVDEKKALVYEFQESGLPAKRFARSKGIGDTSFYRWVKEYGQDEFPEQQPAVGELTEEQFDDIQRMRIEGRTSAKIAIDLQLPLEKVNAAMTYVDYEDYATFNPVK